MANTKQKRHCLVISFADCLNKAAKFSINRAAILSRRCPIDSSGQYIGQSSPFQFGLNCEVKQITYQVCYLAQTIARSKCTDATGSSYTFGEQDHRSRSWPITLLHFVCYTMCVLHKLCNTHSNLFKLLNPIWKQEMALLIPIR